jgi:calcineurin-like phosphoesterase family protein
MTNAYLLMNKILSYSPKSRFSDHVKVTLSNVVLVVEDRDLRLHRGGRFQHGPLSRSLSKID